jgi:putative endonuclease
MFHVYILHSEKLNKYYIGSTSNIEDRLRRHNSGRNTYTKTGLPWKLVYQEDFDTKSGAVLREMEIKKKKSRLYIEALIEQAQRL